MTRRLSNDLRERVLAAVLSGESSRSVAARFGVAVSSVVKRSQRHRATGSAAPGRMGGHRKRILESHRAFIAERFNQNPHLTLHGLKDEGGNESDEEKPAAGEVVVLVPYKQIRAMTFATTASVRSCSTIGQRRYRIPVRDKVQKPAVRSSSA
jgi:transposase-like protein